MEDAHLKKLMEILVEFQKVQKGLMKRVQDLEERLLLNQTVSKN